MCARQSTRIEETNYQYQRGKKTSEEETQCEDCGEEKSREEIASQVGQEETCCKATQTLVVFPTTKRNAELASTCATHALIPHSECSCLSAQSRLPGESIESLERGVQIRLADANDVPIEHKTTLLSMDLVQFDGLEGVVLSDLGWQRLEREDQKAQRKAHARDRLDRPVRDQPDTLKCPNSGARRRQRAGDDPDVVTITRRGAARRSKADPALAKGTGFHGRAGG